MTWRLFGGGLRFRHVFGAGAGSAVTAFAYDRYESHRIQEELLKRAQRIADQPMRDAFQPARHLDVYLSAGTRSEGNALAAGFTRYVKPVWDAAALDYRVVECWLWHDDVRARVARQWEETSAKSAKTETSQELMRQVRGKLGESHAAEAQPMNEGGVVAMGRSAYKGVVCGLADVVTKQSVLNPMSTSESPEQVLDDKEASKAPEQAPSNTSNQASWWQPWKSAKGTEDRGAPSDPHGPSMSTTEQPSLALPSLGFLPYEPIGWFRWLFLDRQEVQRVGQAALVIAEGYSVPIKELFPGSMQFTVEEKERTSENTKSPESLESPVVGESDENEEEPIATGYAAEFEQVTCVDAEDGKTIYRIPEGLLQPLRLYTYAPVSEGIDDENPVRE